MFLSFEKQNQEFVMRQKKTLWEIFADINEHFAKIYLSKQDDLQNLSLKSTICWFECILFKAEKDEIENFFKAINKFKPFTKDQLWKNLSEHWTCKVFCSSLFQHSETKNYNKNFKVLNWLHRKKWLNEDMVSTIKKLYLFFHKKTVDLK